MTLNQAKLLEEALTGCNREILEMEEKKAQISTLVVDTTTPSEVPLPPSAFDFVMLLDISDNSSLDRMNDTMGKLDILPLCFDILLYISKLFVHFFFDQTSEYSHLQLEVAIRNPF